MSSRVMKKLASNKCDILKSDEKDNKEETQAEFRKFNRYDLLNTGSDSESNNEEDENKIETFKTENNVAKKRKNRHKSKKKKPYKVFYDGQDDTDIGLVEESNTFYPHSNTAGFVELQTYTYRKIKTLYVEPKYLDHVNEFKRMFGTKVVNQRDEYRTKRGNRQRYFCVVKSGLFIWPKENWPPVGRNGLTMKYIETKNGFNYFEYEHSAEYRKIQQKFLASLFAVSMDYMMELAEDHPYHIDMLIQLSYVSYLGEDYSVATEFLERALYAMETAFHPMFKICNGDCRLDYLKQENRALFILLFKYMLLVAKRSCYRTALEINKTLLSLDPEVDPLAAILITDYFAIRAGEYKWLLEFIDTWEPIRNLTQLPNIMISKAVSHFCLHDDKADELMIDALLCFPFLIPLLADKCSISVDSRVKTHQLFTLDSYSEEPKSVIGAVILYVEINHYIWKEKGVLSWLERIANKVIELADGGDPRVEEYKKIRRKRFRSIFPTNIKRYIILSNMTHLLPAPEDHVHYYHFDPLPPSGGRTLYAIPGRLQRDDGFLSSILDSLVPSFQQLAVHRREPVVDANRTHTDHLRDGVANFLSSVRDLLTTFERHYPLDHERNNHEPDND